MVDKPIQKAIEGGIERTKQETKNLCPWLPDPFRCSECQTYCDATVEFVRQQAMPVKIWKCPNEECGQRYYRNRE
jgi:hypothetical protein